jgi:hypothetical protein
MKILLILAAAMLLATTVAQRPGLATASPPERPRATPPSAGLGPDLVRGAVRRATGLDRLQPLLARGLR